MIITVSELRQFVHSDLSDQVLEAKLHALESLIRSYTNNNFMVRSIRAVAVAVADHSLVVNGSIASAFHIGDTLQITGSDLQQDMLVTIESIDNGTIFVDQDLIDESGVVVTKVKYPADVKMGCINMLQWDLDNRSKVGIQSETLSRHSVTYFNMDNGNSTIGYPSSLTGFLKPYKKARFGGGL